MTSILAATLLGASSGLRSMTPLAALALSGRLGGSPAVRRGLVVAAAGELVADKLPQTPPRTSPPALAGRLATGALAGWKAAGSAGTALGAGASAGTSFAGLQLRGALGDRTGWPDPAIALAEDALAAALAFAAVRGRGNTPGPLAG